MSDPTKQVDSGYFIRVNTSTKRRIEAIQRELKSGTGRQATVSVVIEAALDTLTDPRNPDLTAFRSILAAEDAFAQSIRFAVEQWQASREEQA